MQRIQLLRNKNELLKIASLAFNLLFLISSILIVIYITAPLFGGKLLITALMGYASWMFIALVGKYFLNRVMSGHSIRIFDYLIIYFAIIINIIVWFQYPVNLIAIILCLLIFTLIYYKLGK